jgi:hypothetical protein
VADDVTRGLAGVAAAGVRLAGRAAAVGVARWRARSEGALAGGIRLALDGVGLVLLSVAGGLVAAPLGVAVAGVGCLVMSWRLSVE